MNNINLSGRLPQDLPDKMTIDDILLELEDTNDFDINWIDLKSMSSYINWRADNKVFENWIQRGQVSIMRCEPMPISISEDWWSTDAMPMSTMTYKETRYDIFRYPIRLEVNFKKGIFQLDNAKETIESVKETYLRLKDYLGPDVIQDQIDIMNFTMDIMISEVVEVEKCISLRN